MARKAVRQRGAAAAYTFRVNPRVGSQVVASPELKAVLTLVALKVERAARRNAPVDTGLLRNSISHRIRTELGTQARVVAEVGTNLSYAATQEFGSRDGRTPATRFLGRALEEVRGQLGA